jgi:hypothetical protein
MNVLIVSSQQSNKKQFYCTGYESIVCGTKIILEQVFLSFNLKQDSDKVFLNFAFSKFNFVLQEEVKVKV